MKRVIFVTGRTCVGKSTMMQNFFQNHEVLVLSTSEVAKRVLPFDEMAKGQDPTAPHQADAAVFKAIEEAVASPVPDVYVDSAPRTAAQVEWIEDLAKRFPAAEFEVWYCYCDDGVRAQRVKARAGDVSKVALTEARIKTEDTNFVAVMERLAASTVPVRMMDLTHVPTVRKVMSAKTDLGAMFDAHSVFNDMVMTRFGTSSARMREDGAGEQMEPFSDTGCWMRRFLRAARNEIDEALREVPDEWWTVDQVNVPKVRVEIIDAWHFLMSAAFTAGMDAEAFAREYFRKRAINIERQRSKTYSKRPPA